MGVGVFLQQQRDQAMALPLTDVVQSCVPLLETMTPDAKFSYQITSERLTAAERGKYYRKVPKGSNVAGSSILKVVLA